MSNRLSRNAKFWRWLARERQFCSLCYAEGRRTQLGSVTEVKTLTPAGYASSMRLRLIAHVRVFHPAMLSKVSET